MDLTVSKRNAQAEKRLAEMTLPALRDESRQKLAESVERTTKRYDLISQVAKRHGVDPDELYMKYVIETRGAKDPERPGTSAKGATGPFQLMPTIRKKFEDKSVSDPFERDADAAARFLSDLQKRNQYSNPEIRAAAYNFGEGNVRDWGGDASKSLNDETTNYVAYQRHLMSEMPKLLEAKRSAAGDKAELAARQASPMPKKMDEDMNIFEYYGRRAMGSLESPQEYEAKVAARQAGLDAARQQAKSTAFKN